jgi:glycosyltransferase involved in cell wall biosynthesis
VIDTVVNERTDRLTILHVTAPAQVGGLERVVEALTVGHAEAGHSVHVIAVVDSAEHADRFLRPLVSRGVHAHPVVVASRAYLRERASIRDICQSIAPSVMHTHGYRADVLAAGVARSLGIPTVTTVHGFTGGSARNRFYEALQVRAFRRFDAVVAVSRPLGELLRSRGVPSSRLRLIVNAWTPLAHLGERSEARSQLGLDPTAFCVGWVGRLTHEKGADVLLDAVPQLHHDISVSFIGDGRERAALQARAIALGVSDRVHWHGVIGDAATLLRAFDAFVLSSRTEGTPMVLFEAMGARVPIVATRVGGVPDVLTASDAVLVAPEDPSALTGAIRGIRDDPGGAALRADAARLRLERVYSAEPWLAAYERLYREVQHVES